MQLKQNHVYNVLQLNFNVVLAAKREKNKGNKLLVFPTANVITTYQHTKQLVTITVF